MLKNYHPRSAAIYLLAWFILALFINDLKTLIVMLLLVAIINYAEDKVQALLKIMLMILPLTIFIMGLNLLLADYGQTVLFIAPDLPLLGELTIYQEPLINSLAMGVKLLLLISIFTVFNTTITADKLFSIFGRYSGSTVLMAVLARRMVPLLGSHARSIAEVQSLRSSGNASDSLADKIRNAGPFLTNLLRASLDSSMQTAEAMQLRAYGSGTRTCFVPEIWQSRDTLITAVSLLVMLFFLPAQSGLAGEYGVLLLLVLLFASQLTRGFKRP